MPLSRRVLLRQGAAVLLVGVSALGARHCDTARKVHIGQPTPSGPESPAPHGGVVTTSQGFTDTDEGHTHNLDSEVYTQ